MNFEKVGGRRFTLALLTLFSTSALTWLDKIDGTIYSMVIIATVGALIAGHTIEHTKNFVRPDINDTK